MRNGLLNVIPENTLKELLTDVTESIAEVLSHTFGPYGKNALVQTTGSVYSTKDGWNVMQLLRVSDKKGENAITVNALKKLHQDVAQAVLLNAGDGTTASTLGAASLNKLVSEYLETHKLDARAIENALTEACDMVVDEILTNGTMINDENMRDIINRIALVSTNWDEEISSMISEIYWETKNPIIKVEDSGTLETSVKYINGYDLVGHLELPNFYLTSPAKGLFEAKNPLILTFGSSVHKDKLQAFILAGGMLRERSRALVLVAPSYDQDFLNTLTATNAQLIQQGKMPVNVVPFKYFAKTDIDRDCVEDFTVATGGILITHEISEVESVFGQLETIIRNKTPEKGSGKKPIKNENQIISECIETLEKLGGTCTNLTATDKYILASDLFNMNKEEFGRRKDTLENELEQKYKQYHAESSLTEMIRLKRLRLGKMQCNMGIIQVGGFGAAHLKAKRDAIDDATRACEVAYQGGYIVDGGMAIPLAARRAIEWYDGKTLDDHNQRIVDFLKMFEGAFRSVACTLFNNKYDDMQRSTALVDTCMERKSPYDLINEEFTEDLITPVAVCKEILNGCLRLVLINATSNQFVFMNEDDLIRAIQAGSVVTDENNDEE